MAVCAHVSFDVYFVWSVRTSQRSLFRNIHQAPRAATAARATEEGRGFASYLDYFAFALEAAQAYDTKVRENIQATNYTRHGHKINALRRLNFTTLEEDVMIQQYERHARVLSDNKKPFAWYDRYQKQ